MAKRPNTFKFRLCDEERAAIAALAARLRRSQSDVLRFLVIEAARELNGNTPTQRDAEREPVPHQEAAAYVTA